MGQLSKELLTTGWGNFTVKRVLAQFNLLYIPRSQQCSHFTTLIHKTLSWRWKFFPLWRFVIFSNLVPWWAEVWKIMAASFTFWRAPEPLLVSKLFVRSCEPITVWEIVLSSSNYSVIIWSECIWLVHKLGHHWLKCLTRVAFKRFSRLALRRLSRVAFRADNWFSYIRLDHELFFRQVIVVLIEYRFG